MRAPRSACQTHPDQGLGLARATMSTVQRDTSEIPAPLWSPPRRRTLSCGPTRLLIASGRRQAALNQRAHRIRYRRDFLLLATPAVDLRDLRSIEPGLIGL